METLSRIYRENLSLLTDLYQLTMAYAAWKNGDAHKQGVFELYFRHQPFQGGYAINCGLDAVLELIRHYRFDPAQGDYLKSLKGSDGTPLFEVEFVDYLLGMRLSVDMEAIEEGRVVFANEPLLRVQGPLIQCQMLETPLLNLVNFQTLIATKAARVKSAAGTDLVLEFGLRRAHGPDGGLSATRAAYIGGIDATSNLLAGKVFSIPVRGTHAHSWVMAYENEPEAFRKFAEAMPNNSIFLVDTYDSLQGVKNAIEVGRWLKSQGHDMQGVRLDSGDLAYFSIEARRLLDNAGFTHAKIVASNDLDEHLIANLKLQGARIDVWGVGTKLVTAYDQPALGGVFKLCAVKNQNGEWKDRIKISEQISKVTTPGIHQVRRYYADDLFTADMIYDVRTPPSANSLMIDPADPTRRKLLSQHLHFEDLLIPVVRNGEVTYTTPTLEETRSKREHDLQRLHPTILRFLNPHQYPVGLEHQLHEKRSHMILEQRRLPV